jgi:Flp pilus assembly protein TadB
VAPTKRKRQTKHRGNAAGVVESRGRTGRKPTAAEKSGDTRELAKARKKAVDPRDRPPTWRGAFVPAMFAAVIFLLIVLIGFKGKSNMLALFPVVLIVYVPITYWTQKRSYERRQRKKAEGKIPADLKGQAR